MADAEAVTLSGEEIKLISAAWEEVKQDADYLGVLGEKTLCR